jgi:hypothetical protein
MPVYTGPPVPLAQHTSTVLNTAGPFARQQAHTAPLQPAAREGCSSAVERSPHAAEQEAHAPRAEACAAENGNAVLQTNDLSFSYPGIGALLQHGNRQAGLAHRLWNRDVAAFRAHLTIHLVCPADGRPLPGVPPVVRNMSIQLPPGARCLLIGPNGAPLSARGDSARPALFAVGSRHCSGPLHKHSCVRPRPLRDRPRERCPPARHLGRQASGGQPAQASQALGSAVLPKACR